MDQTFAQAMSRAELEVKELGVDLNPGRWQGIDTVGKPDLVTREVLNWQCAVPVNRLGHTFHADYTLLDHIAYELQPARKWADEHFAERIGGKPMNPDPSHERWPHWHGQDSVTKSGGQFSHTYSERFWPARVVSDEGTSYGREGIRYKYGDYSDLLLQLGRDPYTRQAYLPIFFPEDTGGIHRGRVPCTLGYHFMQRDNQLHLWYDIRSCDLYRHMRDDLYLAVRLMLHTLEKLKICDGWRETIPGTLFFCAHSLHIHKGDWHHVYSH